MKLPSVDKPVYEVKLISRDKPIKVRPFLVREQKILLMAKESKEIDSIVNSLKQIVKNCIIDTDVDVDKLPMIDLEIIFLNLAAKSKGEVVNFYYKCNNVIKSGDPVVETNCGMVIEEEVNLLQIPIKYEQQTGKIMLNETTGVQMKLPTFETIKRLTELVSDVEKDYLTVALCVDYAFDNDGVYKFDEASEDEKLNFIENLPEDKYGLLEDFLRNSPTIKKEIDRKCPKCDYQHKFVLEGIEDFFI